MEVTVRMVLYTQQSYSIDGGETFEENAHKGIEYFVSNSVIFFFALLGHRKSEKG